jgi:hypothetical protein
MYYVLLAIGDVKKMWKMKSINRKGHKEGAKVAKGTKNLHRVTLTCLPAGRESRRATETIHSNSAKTCLPAGRFA